MTRLKFLPWALGVCLLVGSMVGANWLLQDEPPTAGGNDKAIAPPTGETTRALIVHGKVATEPEPVPYFGSPLLPAARVIEVIVKEGQEVAVGDPLYRFDDSAAQADIAKAEAAVEVAKRNKELAEHQQQVEQQILINKAELAVSAAKRHRSLTRQGLDTVTSRLEANFRKDLGTGREVDPVEVRRRVESDPQYLTALGAVEQAEAAVQEKEYALQQAQKAPYEEQVRQADAAVKLAEADLAKAKLVAAETVVRAKVAGVVERLEAAPGLVVGPTTRTPLLWLVPNGPRVVRAEVVPEFAFRIQERLGQPVTIMDDNNPTLTYPGEVKHVGGSFLPKRSGGGEFVVGRPQAVLEVIVTVTDPAPPGKPPLRVGQPVRVSIGQ